MNGRWTKKHFDEYHRTHPGIYELFKRFTYGISKKRKQYSAKAIFHRIRWEIAMTRDEAEEFKIDDGWISHYARLFIEENPHLEGLFEFRERRNSYHDKQENAA